MAENARRIRLGDTNLELNNRDFQFIPAPDFDRAADLLVMRYLEEVRKYGVDNVALLTPYREKTATGARTINKRLRDIVNPASPDKPELVIGQRLFRLGDKVMQNKNTEEVSNGDIGYITGIESMDDSFTVEVDFGDSRLGALSDGRGSGPSGACIQPPRSINHRAESTCPCLSAFRAAGCFSGR